MPLDRTELPSPLNVGVIDLNGPGSFAYYDFVVRDYHGVIPSVDTAVVPAGELLVLRPWQNELHFHAELVAIIGRDVVPCEGERVPDALLGYSLWLGIWDTAPVSNLKTGLARDVTLNVSYGHLIDGSRQQGHVVLAVDDLSPLDELVLTLQVPGRPPAKYRQKDRMFDVRRMLHECSKLRGFCRGDLICLGPTDAPIVMHACDRFPEGSIIRVEGTPFPPVEVPIEDRYDPANASPWPGCTVEFVARCLHLRGNG